MSDRVSTHMLGVMCAICRTVLVDDECRCGQRHGFLFQESNAWAARTWRFHPCFIGETDDAE